MPGHPTVRRVRELAQQGACYARAADERHRREASGTPLDRGERGVIPSAEGDSASERPLRRRTAEPGE